MPPYTGGVGSHVSTEAGQLNPVCGDSILTPYDNYTEPCDDGAQFDGDGCSHDCVVENGYACRIAGQSCYLITCGDGKIDAPETCDDGDTIDADGCNSDCHVTTSHWCQSGEPSICQSAPSGSVASAPIYILGGANESMTGKNGPDGPGSANGQVAYFYAPMVTGGIKLNVLSTFSGAVYTYNRTACQEMGCDPSGQLDAAGFAANTTTTLLLSGNSYSPEFVVQILADAPTSGNVFIEAVPACGDGHVDTGFGEQCDDGELVPNDGCSTDCTLDTGWTCTGEPSSCKQTT